MQLHINGEPRTFDAPLNIYDLLAQEGMIEMMIGVARNGTIVSRDAYKDTTLEDGDLVEIVAAMQGG